MPGSAADPPAAAPPRSAAWLAPHVAALALAAGLGLMASFWPSFVAVGAVLGLAWLAVALWRCALAGLRGERIAFVRRLALVLVLLVTPGVFSAGNTAGWLARLMLYKPAYDAAVARQPLEATGRLVLFPWGHYLIYDELCLAYDEADQLRRPQAAQSAEFRARLAAAIAGQMRRRSNAPAFAHPRWDATPIWGHYYVIDAHG
jgi:hypothetical protein